MQKLFVLIVGVAVAAGLAHAETVGLWTFDGTAGEALPGAETTIPNLINGSPIKLTTGSSDSQIPVPSYADEVQGSAIYSDSYCTNLLATTATSLKLQIKGGGSKWGWNKHAFLAISNAVSLANESFTLEFVYRQTDPNVGSGWTGMWSLPAHGATFYGNGIVGSVFTYNGGTQAYPTSKLPDRFGWADANWHHWGVCWNNETKTVSFYHDYRSVDSKVLTKEVVLTDTSDLATLFKNEGSNNYPDVFVQVVRLSTGVLATGKFLLVQPSTESVTADTFAHWRFESAVSGEAFGCSPAEGYEKFVSMAFATAKDSTAIAGVEPWKACVSDGGRAMKTNVGAVGPGSGSFGSMPLTQDQHLRATKSFTYECFMNFPSAACSGSTGKGILFGISATRISGYEYNNSEGLVFYHLDNSASETQAKFSGYVYLWKDAEHTGYTTYYASPLLVPINTWFHFALTYDDETKTLKIFKDRTLVATKTFVEPNVPAFYGNLWALQGNNFNCNAGFQGKLDEIRISRRALDPSEFLKPRTGEGLTILFR